MTERDRTGIEPFRDADDEVAAATTARGEAEAPLDTALGAAAASGGVSGAVGAGGGALAGVGGAVGRRLDGAPEGGDDEVPERPAEGDAGLSAGGADTTSRGDIGEGLDDAAGPSEIAGPDDPDA